MSAPKHDTHGRAPDVEARAQALAKTITDDQLGSWFCTPGGVEYAADPMGLGRELSPVGRRAFEIRRGVSS
jgi:hypothetical protein